MQQYHSPNLMQKPMNIAVNGQSQVPPGFRFHPTEEELLLYYLKKKLSSQEIDLDVIRDVDLNKLEPWDIQEKCKIGTTPQNDWYFFSHKDRKYPTGSRTNRATAAGFWKATGRDKVIYGNGRRIGMRKTLVFYKGRAPHGTKSDWIMHEYRLDDSTITDHTIVSNDMGEAAQEGGWVVCRTFKKKDHHKTSENSCRERALSYKEESYKEENQDGAMFRYSTIDASSINRNNEKLMLMKLPALIESPINSVITEINEGSMTMDQPAAAANTIKITNWATFDRLVASQLNGCSQSEMNTDTQIQPANSFNESPTNNNLQVCCSNPTADNDDDDQVHGLQLPTLKSSFPLPRDIDLWSLIGTTNLSSTTSSSSSDISPTLSRVQF